ncbi:MAG: hypothetical protein M3Y81_16490 [Chloroflexota bacterium]|nr:hypothetical protein [Chloroflexota bacterium]
MEEDATLVTREQYIEMLIDASFREASEMEAGFTSWCEHHVPTWRQEGYDETWIRHRIETAQITRGLHRTLKEQSLTMLAIRDELRQAYADHPELYDLARAHESLHPGLLRYRGNTGDLRQRYTLRVLIYETDKLAYEKFCRWSGLPVPSPDLVFFEQPESVCVVRDLSTVEELELMLAMSRYALHLFDAPENLAVDQVSPLMEAHGKHLRATFIATHGYRPEDSATPYVPVTIDGPQDHDAYYAKEYP